MHFVGTLWQHGRPALATVSGTIRRSAGGSGAWFGDLIAPPGIALRGGLYRLELSTGQAGDVFLAGVSAGGLVPFDGFGTLA